MGAIGVWAGYPLADPVIGLVISIAIFAIVWQSARLVLARTLDAVEPEVVDTITHAAGRVANVEEVRHQLLHHLPHLGRVMVHIDPQGEGGERHHRIGEHTLPVHSHNE